jgi:hypothetical protein
MGTNHTPQGEININKEVKQHPHPPHVLISILNHTSFALITTLIHILLMHNCNINNPEECGNEPTNHTHTRIHTTEKSTLHTSKVGRLRRRMNSKVAPLEKFSFISVSAPAEASNARASVAPWMMEVE